jgi:hypothetical protein
MRFVLVAIAVVAMTVSWRAAVRICLGRAQRTVITMTSKAKA